MIKKIAALLTAGIFFIMPNFAFAEEIPTETEIVDEPFNEPTKENPQPEEKIPTLDLLSPPKNCRPSKRSRA